MSPDPAPGLAICPLDPEDWPAVRAITCYTSELRIVAVDRT